MKYQVSILSISILMSCSNSPKEEVQNEEPLVEELTSVQIMEESHHKQEFLSNDNIKFDIRLNFGGKERLNGTMTLATNSSQGLIETKDGNKVYFIKDKVYCSPEMDSKSARFSAYTWSYFFLLPYKLNDEGTIWSESEKVEMNGNWFNTQRLTFTSGTGDAPEDWYQIYSDTDKNLLQVAAYIVTAGRSVEKAEEDPHAIQYLNYQMHEKIPFAREWKFYGWTKTDGLTDTLGNATLYNFEFVADNDSLYTPPANFLSN